MAESKAAKANLRPGEVAISGDRTFPDVFLNLYQSCYLYTYLREDVNRTKTIE